MQRGGAALKEAVADIGRPVYVLEDVTSEVAVASSGEARIGSRLGASGNDRAIVGYATALRLDCLGDPQFLQTHRLRLAAVAGAMANGIASVELVCAMARGGMLGIFGAAGLSLAAVDAAISRLQASLGDLPFGVNLIHSPNEPDLERQVVELYLRRGVRLVEASAYMRLTLPLIRYRVHGIYRDDEGTVIAPNRVIAKASRVEVATRFFSPPPDEFLQELVASGDITAAQAIMAREIPVAEDLTAEADSGGHTDNRPALGLLPTIIALRDRMQLTHGYRETLRVGAAGGIATPHSAAAAFAMGAAYILLGSVNQSCVESGTSDAVRRMLAQSEQADIAMAPAADMFEMGVKVQVLKRGTMFAMRANRLYDLYRAYESIEEIPAAERAKLEATVLGASFDHILTEVHAYFAARDPAQWERAQVDKKHEMALAFRWYLGHASLWANRGEPSRKLDYQIWCGPAMGAFNAWVRDTYLAEPANRGVVVVSLNLLYGAAVMGRLQALRSQGVRMSPELQQVLPRTLRELEPHLP